MNHFSTFLPEIAELPHDSRDHSDTPKLVLMEHDASENPKPEDAQVQILQTVMRHAWLGEQNSSCTYPSTQLVRFPVLSPAPDQFLGETQW